MKKIYGFCKSNFYKDTFVIKEFEVVKETEKQYKIAGCVWSTINKNIMAVSDYEFYETKDEAVEGLIGYCKCAIDWANNTIKNKTNEIKRLQKVIEVNTK